MNPTEADNSINNANPIRVEVLGPGCPRCVRLAERVEQAFQQLPPDLGPLRLVKVRAWDEMLGYEGLRALPALALNGRVVCCGQVPTVETLAGWIGEARLAEPEANAGAPFIG